MSPQRPDGQRPALAAVPAVPAVPRSPRGPSLPDRVWETGQWLRFRVLGDMILARFAPRRMREAAWRDGFEAALGSGRPNWWLSMLEESEEGNAAGWQAAPRRLRAPARPEPAPRRLRDRLPATRGYVDARIASADGPAGAARALLAVIGPDRPGGAS